MALQAVVAHGFVVSYGVRDYVGSKFGVWTTWNVGFEKTQKWNLVVRCEGDDKQSLPDNLGSNLASLPKPLSVSESSGSNNNGVKVRIAFKGLPGAYSEDAALKAYPHCQTVPCEEFEDVLKADFGGLHYKYKA